MNNNNYPPRAVSEEAEQKKETLLLIINNLPQGLLFFDHQDRVSVVNSQAERMLGVKEKDLLGKFALELIEIPNLRFLGGFWGEGRKASYQKEVEVRKNLILEISTLPLVRGGEWFIGRSGRSGLLVILRDITRERGLEQLKSEFVSLAAHQMRTPLSATKWSLRMMLDGELGKLSPDQTSFLEKAYQNNERMISLINDLLNVAKIEEGRHIFNPVFTDFEPIIQFVITSSKADIKEKRLKFEFMRSKKSLPRLKLDVAKMKLAIQNLLDNAIKYTLPGGKITISLRQVDNEIECTVKDNGVGIFEEEQKRVFTKFFRGSNVIRMETEGSGLGLFITKNIIEAHGGKIWFESKPGMGSTFYFTLPIEIE